MLSSKRALRATLTYKCTSTPNYGKYHGRRVDTEGVEFQSTTKFIDLALKYGRTINGN